MNIHRIAPRPPKHELYFLSPDDGWFSIVVPESGQNLVTRPSFEIADLGGWSGDNATIARSTDYQTHGAYSLKITPTGVVGASAGVHFGDVSMTAGQPYTASLDFRGIGGVLYRLYIADTGGNAISVLADFYASGLWERRVVHYTETASVNRRLYVLRDAFSSNNSAFYIDAAQIENKLYDTSYIDGEQQGLVIVPGYPAYTWDGTPHASTSKRSANTRSGGRVIKLRDLGFNLLSIVGLGMVSPSHSAIDYAYLNGSLYQRTVFKSRLFTLMGDVYGTSYEQLQQTKRKLEDYFGIDYISPQQPLVLLYTPKTDCKVAIEDTRQLVCVYNGGMEGDISGLYHERVSPQFQMFMPFVASAYDSGVALSAHTAISVTGTSILKRDTSGLWALIGTVAGGSAAIDDMIVGSDGATYVTGNFTSINGVLATNIARRSVGGVWSNIGDLSATGQVLVNGPDGKLYVGFNGTTAGQVLAVPAQPSAVGIIPGTLALATYTYAVTAYKPGGETTASPVKNITLAPGQGGVVVSWTAIPGATGYKVYGRTGLGLMQDVGNVLTFSDTGSITPGAAPPGANTSNTANYVAVYDPSTGFFQQVGDGLNALVRDLNFSPDGTLYFAGDATKNAANTTALNYAGRLVSNLWVALTDTTTGNIGLALGGDGLGSRAVVVDKAYAYYFGSFLTTNGGGVTLTRVGRWTIASPAWTIMGTGGMDGLPTDAEIAPDGSVYAVGAFATAGGVSALHIAKWQGTLWQAVGAGMIDTIVNNGVLSFGPDGLLYVFVAANVGLNAATGKTSIWNGSNYLPHDFATTAADAVNPGYVSTSNEILINFPSIGGTAYGAGVTTVNNTGQENALPVITVTNPTTNVYAVPVYELTNFTTNQAIYFNGLSLSPGETLTLDFSKPSFTTDFRGNISSYIIPGNKNLFLQPGNNSISLFAHDATAQTITAKIVWRNLFQGVQ